MGRDDDRPLGSKVSGGTAPARIWKDFMVSAIAVDGRRGPPLPAEFRIPQNARPGQQKKSPLPSDWSESTRGLREALEALDRLFDGR